MLIIVMQHFNGPATTLTKTIRLLAHTSDTREQSMTPATHNRNKCSIDGTTTLNSVPEQLASLLLLLPWRLLMLLLLLAAYGLL